MEVGSGAAERRSSDQRRTSPSQRRNNWSRSIRRRHHSYTPHYGSQRCSCMSIAGICMRMWSYSRHSLGRSPRTFGRRSIYWEVGTLGVRRPRGRAALRWRVTGCARRAFCEEICQLGAPCWLLHDMGSSRASLPGAAQPLKCLVFSSMTHDCRCRYQTEGTPYGLSLFHMPRLFICSCV